MKEIYSIVIVISVNRMSDVKNETTQLLKYLILIGNVLCLTVRKLNQKSAKIPVHKLKETTGLGIYMKRFFSTDNTGFERMEAHRDDHYIFILQECGYSEFVIDFKKIEVNGFAVHYLMPGQVHEINIVHQSSFFFMAIDTSLVDLKYRDIFEKLVLHHQSLEPLPDQARQISRSVELLYDVYQQPLQQGINDQILHSLASAYIGMVAAVYEANEPIKDKRNPRPEIITREFKRLLSSQFKTLKSPAEYAEALYLSLSYLTEAVKSITGFPVGYWIHQEIILEAKRLLYYSDMNVKEIAFSLGYEDHTYFSRLFAKVAGCSPLQFRKQYRGGKDCL
ncbi:AraC family transcriptional regulator [Pedobacter sp. L105]|uniref:helix-turn-helix domain-containing protein n=1 Tax=Pedobacter sp. L105 TaxID=1641871 RepID=UPI00131D9D2D|nr:helix-turn-helix transcriptional regulator [Pedobacter sp. L105]